MQSEIIKIGIIGLGFVGTAIRESYKSLSNIDLILIDSDPAKNCTGTYEDLKDAVAVFVCVPSPSNEDLSCNSQPLIETLEKLQNFSGVIISKVTAPPAVYDALQQQYSNLVHVPEFLTAANAVNDYLSSNFNIIGGIDKEKMDEAHKIIKLALPNLQTTYYCLIGEASLAKYTINCFLATKVVFMNEMAQLAKIGGQNWNRIRDLISLDTRMGYSHTQVPGPDGFYGFGGACFPKDTAALLKYAEELSVQMNVLDTAVKKNTILRLTN